MLLKSSHYFLFSLITISLFGCVQTNVQSVDQLQLIAPLSIEADQQLATRVQTELTIDDNWLSQFDDPLLIQALDKALQQNYALKQQAISVEIKQQQLLNANGEFWPSLTAAVSQSRQENSAEVISNSATISLKASLSLDVWGKLSAQAQQANLSYLAEQANFLQNKQQLMTDFVNAWFAAKSAEKLVVLYQQRVDNAVVNLEMIEQRFQKGLKNARDVYLARNELNSIKASLAQKQQQLLEAKRTLELYLGEYPKAAIQLSDSWPIALKLPSQLNTAQLLSQQPALQAKWYQLLALHAGAAFAHKQRFPSISLTASLSDTQSQLGQLLSSGQLAWSLLANASATLFDAGRLKQQAQIAQLTAERAEFDYLSTVNQVFEQIENALSQQQSLQQQRQLQLEAQANAATAYELMLSQYQQGLVEYSDVLTAQNRWFDAQIAVIQIDNQLVSNLVNLYQAIGMKPSSSLISTLSE